MGRPKKNTTQPASGYVKKVNSIPGSLDIINEADPLWNLLTKKFARVGKVYGFKPVELPFIEDKQLYDSIYKDWSEKLSRLVVFEIGGKPAVLRPSILPSILRAYSQHKIFEGIPISKWMYSGQVVLGDAKGKGILSEYEFGFEVFGTFNHLAEAQLIGGIWELLLSLGLESVSLEINSIGNAECQRVYSENLSDYLSEKKYELCDLCNEHLSGRVLNIFRCSNLGCQAVVSEGPTILDFLDQDSHKQFTNILEALEELGVPYQLNPMHVGADGYSKTNFIIKYKGKNRTVVIGEGGYHDGLLQSICNKNYCCFGFSGNFSKIYEILQAEKIDIEYKSYSEVFLVPLGELAARKSLKLFKDLTQDKITVYDHFGEGGVKNQLKQAEDFKAPVALIMGQKEAMDEMVILRDVKSGMQEIISYDKIVEEVKKRLGK